MSWQKVSHATPPKSMSCVHTTQKPKTLMADVHVPAAPLLDDIPPQWLKMVYDAIVHKKTLLLKQEGEVVFPINPSSYKDMHSFLVDGVRPACHLAMDGCFTLAVAAPVEDALFLENL